MPDETGFQPGDRVYICDGAPDGHHRTPAYVKGKTGWVSTLCGRFPNPETRAKGHSGLPVIALYRVELMQSDLWPGYDGPAEDTLCVDLFEHWLESA